ncbi:hypothetical protein GCM10027160_18740 [Streptomyces calidiresistens]
MTAPATAILVPCLPRMCIPYAFVAVPGADGSGRGHRRPATGGVPRGPAPIKGPAPLEVKK